MYYKYYIEMRECEHTGTQGRYLAKILKETQQRFWGLERPNTQYIIRVTKYCTPEALCMPAPRSTD
jgi:hypothetical protein